MLLEGTRYPAMNQLTRQLATILLALCLIVSLRTAPVRAQTSEFPKDPILRIETGMHTASIRRIAVDNSGKWLVTASLDKTVRIWEVATGQLVRILRVPIAEGDEGKLYGVTISPDGSTIATGGWTGSGTAKMYCIYLFDRESGALRRRIQGLSNVIFDLAFSKDGSRLAAGLGGANGIRVFSVSTGAPLWQDKEFDDSCYGIDFDASGRLVASSNDGQIRLYSHQGTLLGKRDAPHGNQPFAVRFSPDGARIAVGYDDVPRVSVLQADASLTAKITPDTTGLRRSGILGVTWSRDGEVLYGGASDGYRLRRWSGGGAGSYSDLKVAGNTLMDLRTLPDGRIAVGAGGPLWCLVSADNKRIEREVGASIADFRNLILSFLLSPDGSQVAFGYKPLGADPAYFDVTRRTLSTGAASPDLGGPPTVSTAAINVTNWQGNTEPRLNGQMLPLDRDDMSYSLAISSDQRRFLLGTDWNLYCFNSDGTKAWSVAGPGTCLSVNINQANGSIGVAAFRDGTIRWYRMKDGKELLALFPHTDRKRWVAWTPSGYFDCSPGAEDLIGWHLNRGKDDPADFYPASRFRQRFYRPDIITRVLTTLDESEALRLADAALGKTNPSNPVKIAAVLPPVVTITSPKSDTTVSESQLKIHFTIRTPADAPVRALRVLVDGRPVGSGERQWLVVSADSAPAGTGIDREITVPLPEKKPGESVEVTLLAENKNTVSVPASVRVKVQTVQKTKVDKVDADAILKPKLYVLAVGVGRYKNKQVNPLIFPAKDAGDFVAAWKKQAGGLYRDVQVRTLADDAATANGVRDGMDWLEKNVTARDVAIVYFSGHGANDRNQVYHFLTHDFDPERWRSTAIPHSDIRSLLQNLPGKVFLFLDTCVSGNALGGAARALPDLTGLINELTSAESGVVLFAASARFQSALESPEWGNGAFTKAVVEALSARSGDSLSADAKDALSLIASSGKVTLSRLDAYLAERVKQLTSGKQTPTLARPQTIPDLPIAVVK